MNKLSNSNHRTSKEVSTGRILEAAFVNGVALYGIAKEAQRKHRAKRVAKAAAGRPQPTPEAKQVVHNRTPEEQRAFSEKRGKLSYAKQYMSTYLHAPDSLRKMLPRNGELRHVPWSYHQPTSYAGLHLDQSTHAPAGEFKYTKGIDQLVALGEAPLRQKIAAGRAKDPTGTWRTLLDGQDFADVPANITSAASAKAENNRIVGLWAAVQGIGFDTHDLAFANWQDHKDRYSVVPYDRENVLHRAVAAGSVKPIESFVDAGLMVRYSGSFRPEDMSVAVSAVDIVALRAEKGPDMIPPTPDPTTLAHCEYPNPNLPASTAPLGL